MVWARPPPWPRGNATPPPLSLPVAPPSPRTTGCTIGPPYAGIRVGAIDAATPAALAAILATLRAVCDVRLLESGVGEPRPGGLTTYLLTAAQVDALWAHLGVRVRVYVPDLGATLAAAESVVDDGGGAEPPRPRPVSPPLTGGAGGGLPPGMLGLATSPRAANTSTAADGLAVATAPSAAPAQSAAAATEFYTAYRSLTAVNRRMELLAADYPGVAATIPIGKSVLGRQLTALAVGHTPADAPVRVVVLGLQHAREWVAGLVPLYSGEMLVRGAAEHPDLAAFLTRVQLLFVPMVNPDGFVYTVTTDRMWRKNRSDDGSTCPGVDLNRNWGMDWGGPHATSTVEPCRETYTGAAPFSEPETTAIRNLIDAHPGVVGFIDFHAYGELVLGAWAHAEEPPADRPHDKAYGVAVTDGVNQVHASGYRYGTGGEYIYLASGVASDWATAANMSAVTIELRPNNAPGAGLSLGTEFLLPASEVLPTCEEGMGGVIAAARFLERAARGGDDDLEPVDWVPLRGLVTDEGTSGGGADDGGGGGADDNEGGLAVGTIVGISVGAGLVALAALALAVWMVRNRTH